MQRILSFVYFYLGQINFIFFKIFLYSYKISKKIAGKIYDVCCTVVEITHFNRTETRDLMSFRKLFSIKAVSVNVKIEFLKVN